MNLIIRLIVLLGLMPIICYGQVQEPQKKAYTVGIKAGYAISSIAIESDDYFDNNKHGFVLGGFMKIPLLKRIDFQPEILLIQKGERVVVDHFILPYNGVFSRSMIYLSIPLNINYRLSKKVGVLLGTEPSLLLDDNVTVDFPVKSLNAGEINSFDLSLNVGVNLSISRFLVDLRLSQGVASLMNKYGGRNYNSSVQLTLGYKLKS